MKKILAVLLSLVMALTFMMPAFAAEEEEPAFDETINNAIDTVTGIYGDLEEGDYASAVTETLAFLERLFVAIHNLIDQLSEMFGFDCPLCSGIAK